MDRPDKTLLGHEEAQREFIKAWNSGRMHHAWMITGMQGLGKAGFARQAASLVLDQSAENEAEPSSLFAETRIGQMLKDPAHTDLVHPAFRSIGRMQDDRGRMKGRILLDQIRDLIPFFGMAPDHGWRVVIIDALESMTWEASNALLKMLEEPPPQCLFLLISHAPGRLLPTLRSRCRRLILRPLSESQMRLFLQRLDYPTDCEDAVLQYANGCPGRAELFLRLDLAALEKLLDTITPGHQDAALELVSLLSPIKESERYEAFLTLALDRVAIHLKQAALEYAQSSGVLAKGLTLYDRARTLAAQATALNLETRLVILEMASIVANTSTLRG